MHGLVVAFVNLRGKGSTVSICEGTVRGMQINFQISAVEELGLLLIFMCNLPRFCELVFFFLF